jgi:two-component system, NtrC family, sensor kinase
MERGAPARGDEVVESGISERLRWLIRLRWLVVPVFVAVELTSALLTDRPSPWSPLAVGAILLGGNALYSFLLSRRARASTLVQAARIESAVVVASPLVAVVMSRDPSNVLRYGVLVGVVGAAVVLPRAIEIGAVATWAAVALVGADVLALGLDPSRIDAAMLSRWVTEAGLVATVAALGGYLHSARELTAERLRSAVEGLERAKAEWEVAFDGLHEMVFISDPEGRILRANRAFAKVLGARPHELSGRRLPELMAGHPDRWWSTVGDGIVEIEDPIFDTLFEVTSTRIADRIIRVARDVGEQRRLYARLVQADKLAAVGVLASGVAHEINNPTAFVTSNLTELKRYVAAYDAAIAELSQVGLSAGQAERIRALLGRSDVSFARREAANAIAESLQGMERIRQIVSNLRSLARRDQSGEPAAPVELGEVVQAVVRTASSELRTASARVDLRGPLWVLGHRGELVDVVLNLVVNAVQARDEARPNTIAIELFRENQSAVVRVSDSGKGIVPSHLKRLFEPFFTTKAPGEGTGLGLSLARKIILAHGGSIDVASELGVGTTFTVRLPILEDAKTGTGTRRDGGAG